MFVSEALTQGIRVRVQSFFVPERSAPDQNQWLFAYHVSISNEGQRTTQLLRRHWIITDANGQVQEVRGEGVVGKQPVLRPGQTFEYTSACPLQTPFGTMQGSYEMVADGAGPFDAVIAPFTLADPRAVN